MRVQQQTVISSAAKNQQTTRLCIQHCEFDVNSRKATEPIGCRLQMRYPCAKSKEEENNEIEHNENFSDAKPNGS